MITLRYHKKSRSPFPLLHAVYTHLLFILLTIWLCQYTPLMAQEKTPDKRAAEQEMYYQRLDQADKRLGSIELSSEQLEQITSDTLDIEKFVQSCINETGALLNKQVESLKGLGDAIVPGEDALSKIRIRLEKEQKQTEEALAQCRLLAIRAEEIREKALKKQQTILKERLLTTNDSLVTHFLRALQQPQRLTEEGLQILKTLPNKGSWNKTPNKVARSRRRAQKSSL